MLGQFDPILCAYDWKTMRVKWCKVQWYGTVAVAHFSERNMASGLGENGVFFMYFFFSIQRAVEKLNTYQRLWNGPLFHLFSFFVADRSTYLPNEKSLFSSCWR